MRPDNDQVKVALCRYVTSFSAKWRRCCRGRGTRIPFLVHMSFPLSIFIRQDDLFLFWYFFFSFLFFYLRINADTLSWYLKFLAEDCLNTEIAYQYWNSLAMQLVYCYSKKISRTSSTNYDISLKLSKTTFLKRYFLR